LASGSAQATVNIKTNQSIRNHVDNDDNSRNSVKRSYACGVTPSSNHPTTVVPTGTRKIQNTSETFRIQSQKRAAAVKSPFRAISCDRSIFPGRYPLAAMVLPFPRFFQLTKATSLVEFASDKFCGRLPMSTAPFDKVRCAMRPSCKSTSAAFSAIM
jgi:hypothetical protein